jgi:hypothetical protein
MYGPPIPVHLTDFMNGRGKPAVSGPLDGANRRSVYQEVRRNFLEPMMTTFDRPIPFSAFGKRDVTNVPAQSLILMNDPFVLLQAEKMANAVIQQKGLSLDERLQWIYFRSFAREAKPEELLKAKTFIARLAKDYKIKDKDILNSVSVWKDFCHSVFNQKEFIYLI